MAEATKTARLDRDGLRLREALFCHAYIANGGNGTQAAITAGYKGDPKQRASRLLRVPAIAAVINRERKRKLSELDATADRVIRELARCAFLDPRKLFAPDGNSLKPITQLDEGTAAAIASLDFRRTAKKGLVSRVRFWSKLAALELLGSWLDLWKGRGGDGEKDRLDEIVDAIRNSPAGSTRKAKKEEDE